MVRSKPVVWLVAIFAASLACSVSGLSAPASNGPLDSSSLSTIVAGTANAAAAQTAQTNPLTGTLPDASTEAIASTTTATATSPLVFSTFSTALSQQADGSTLFVDKDAGFEFVSPAGWTVFRPNQPEYFKVWTLPVASNPTVQKTLNLMQNVDSNTVRLMGLDLRDGDTQPDLVLTYQVQWQQVTKGTFNDVFDALKEYYSKDPTIYGFKTLSSNVATIAGNMQAGIMELNLTARGTVNSKYQVYEKIVILKTTPGYYLIRLYTTYNVKDTTLPEFNQLIASIKPYNP